MAEHSVTRARGMTLIEALVGVAVFALLLTTALTILVGGMGAWSTTMARTDEQNSVLLSMSRLSDSLTHSDVNSLSLFDSSGSLVSDAGTAATALSFLSGVDPAPLDPDGYCTWNRFQVWYLGRDPDVNSITGKALWRQDVKLAAPMAFPVPYRLATFTPKAGDVRVLSNVDSFDVTSPLRASVLTGTGAAMRDNPVGFQVQVRFQFRLITHAASAVMLEDQRLEPPLDSPTP